VLLFNIFLHHERYRGYKTRPYTNSRSSWQTKLIQFEQVCTCTRRWIPKSYIRKSVHLLLGQTLYVDHSQAAGQLLMLWPSREDIWSAYRWSVLRLRHAWTNFQHCCTCDKIVSTVWVLTITFANSPLCACYGSSWQRPQYGLMTLAYQRFTAVFLLLIYGSLYLNGIYYCLSVFWCAVARMLERTLNFSLNLARVEAKSERC
jgi:hypothetical protein